MNFFINSSTSLFITRYMIAKKKQLNMRFIYPEEDAILLLVTIKYTDKAEKYSNTKAVTFVKIKDSPNSKDRSFNKNTIIKKKMIAIFAEKSDVP